jgi:arabinogalactan oligomer/maltooligosaccharide transport system permease protein
MISLLLTAALADEVVVWHAWRGNEEVGLREAADAFAAASGHTVSLVALPFGAFDSKVETAVPRGNGPDVFIAAHGSLRKWRSMDLLQPVTFDAAAYLPATVEAFTWEGQTWAAPLAFKSLVLLYDPTRVTTPPTTTDALIAAARAETGGGRYGLAWQVAEPYFHAPWMHAFGASALDADGNGTLDGPGQAEALAFARRLAIDEGIAPVQPTGELVARLYAEGKATFVISGPWFVADQTRPIAAAPLPMLSETGQPARPYLTVDGAWLARGAAHPDAARQLIAWLAGPDGAPTRARVGHQAVSLRDVVTDDPLLQVLAAQARDAVPMPTHPDLPTAFEAQARALRSVLRGSATPEAAAAAAQRWFNVLSRPAPPPSDPRPWLAAAGALSLLLLARAASALRANRTDLVAHRHDLLWLLPAVIPLSVLVVAPFVTGALVSLFVHRQGDWTFVGLKNFLDILLSRDWPITQPLSFWFTLAVTLVWTATNVALHAGIGVALAMVLREPWIRLRPLWRALLILPWAIPSYITALVWKSMFHAQYGAINALIGWVTGRDGPAPIDWFGSFALAFSANLVTNTWLGFPFMMVVTLGALQAIPRDLEEAAELDGATGWQRFRTVIWPLLRPALVPALLMGSVWTFNMFNVVFLVSGGEPDGATEILISDAYRWAFSRGNRYGYAAAYAVLIFGVLTLWSRAANKIAGRAVL